MNASISLITFFLCALIAVHAASDKISDPQIVNIDNHSINTKKSTIPTFSAGDNLQISWAWGNVMPKSTVKIAFVPIQKNIESTLLSFGNNNRVTRHKVSDEYGLLQFEVPEDIAVGEYYLRLVLFEVEPKKSVRIRSAVNDYEVFNFRYVKFNIGMSAVRKSQLEYLQKAKRSIDSAIHSINTVTRYPFGWMGEDLSRGPVILKEMSKKIHKILSSNGYEE